ncbi:hypothetical protein XELAEV_18026010mg [Xenopus laevis]|uniref:Uncharacterized protein n=1 Tax=Xenopus laevis TaxID=8355 RepID=A0A974D0N3_XENLA|nr:hypothetical protein XELAEV_18026010mg [Xenopus laevis]
MGGSFTMVTHFGVPRHMLRIYFIICAIDGKVKQEMQLFTRRSCHTACLICRTAEPNCHLPALQTVFSLDDALMKQNKSRAITVPSKPASFKCECYTNINITTLTNHVLYSNQGMVGPCEL